MANILEKIGGMGDKDLLRLFVNAQQIVNGRSKGPEEQAQAVINKIQSEWKSRLTRARAGNYKASLPEIGMLKTFGYSVGESGERKEVRREALQMVFDSELPLVGSPAYTVEWGEPRSRKRVDKMKRSLAAFISNADPGWEKAILEWQEDLDFIRQELSLN